MGVTPARWITMAPAAAFVWVALTGAPPLSAQDGTQARMSFSNRLLLNRAVVNNRRTLEVLLLVPPARMKDVSVRVVHSNGHVRYTEARVGYMRVDVPIDRFLAVVTAPDIEAFQIASSAAGAWYRDAVPEYNAAMFRKYERSPPGVIASPEVDATLPVLPADVAHRLAYTAQGAGVKEWLDRHPTFDGRGVTVAIVESAGANFLHPSIGTAKTLDGRELRKIAGVFNTADAAHDDDSRVPLDTPFEARTSWTRVGGRTYTVPHPGRYRLGTYRPAAATNLVHEFPVIEDEQHDEVFIDTDGDSDFTDERPMRDVNDAFDVQALTVTYPAPSELPFVMTRGHAPHTVHIYTASAGHTAMVLSVVAGRRRPDDLAPGVAPGSRVLLVPVDFGPSMALSAYLEAFLETIARPDVDILCDAMSIFMAPDTSGDFIGLLFSRMIDAYQKPIFHAAGNNSQLLNNVSSVGGVFSVGGSIAPDAFAAFFGGARLPGLMVHPVTGAGPAMDGALKPDFLAPVHVIAADVPGQAGQVAVPRNVPRWRLPPGYQVSCCTSSSAPYAAGIGALLVSAARQSQVPYTVRALGRALRASATYLPAWPAYEQGSGVLDVNAAWQALQRRPEIPRIEVESSVVHVLAEYAARGNTGPGLFEREGWHAGMRGRRVFRFTRTSGPSTPVAYRVSWTGNDGTFTSPTSIRLPFGTTVELPMAIEVASAGGHTAILNLHDPATDAIILRTQATIIASEMLDRATQAVELSGTLALMRTRTHYVEVPEGAGALDVEVTVNRGSLWTVLMPVHSLYPAYYGHVHPFSSTSYTPGTYHVMIPHPAAGVWGVNLRNDSPWNELDPERVAFVDASYTISLRVLGAGLTLAKEGADALAVTVQNTGSALQEPALEVATGLLRTARAAFLPSGLPNTFDIDVPPGTATLALRARSADGSAPSLELHLYDCTAGYCFSYDFTVPSARQREMTLRHPRAGRWVAAVNAAPLAGSTGDFVFEWMTATTSTRHQGDARTRHPGERWAQTIPRPAAATGASPRNAVLVELVDAAAERRVRNFPWSEYKYQEHMDPQPVAAASAIWRIQ